MAQGALAAATAPKQTAATPAVKATRVARTRWAGSGAVRLAGARSHGQVGEQGGQFFPGAGGQGLPGSLVEFVGGDPAGLEGHAQLAERPVAVGVGYPEVTGGIVPAGSVHDSCSFGADSSVTP